MSDRNGFHVLLFMCLNFVFFQTVILNVSVWKLLLLWFINRSQCQQQRKWKGWSLLMCCRWLLLTPFSVVDAFLLFYLFFERVSSLNFGLHWLLSLLLFPVVFDNNLLWRRKKCKNHYLGCIMVGFPWIFSCFLHIYIWIYHM